jgi:hypothetical protein
MYTSAGRRGALKIGIPGKLAKLIHGKDTEHAIFPAEGRGNASGETGGSAAGSKGAGRAKTSPRNGNGKTRSGSASPNAASGDLPLSLREIAVLKASLSLDDFSRGKRTVERKAQGGTTAGTARAPARLSSGGRAKRTPAAPAKRKSDGAVGKAGKNGGSRFDPSAYRREEYVRLDPDAKLSRAISCMRSTDQKIRPRSAADKPGGLVEFPPDDDREMIVVGDIHANRRNLKAVLMDRGNLNKLARNEAVVIFLGDIVHDERTGYLCEMESSIEVLDIVIHLINRYPGNVYYLRGNHDTLSPRLSKSGIQQGVIFRKALVERRGAGYAELVWDFFGTLPVFVKHRWFLAMHGGPVRGGIGRQELINVAHYQDCEHQLIWNRINETHSTPSRKEYAPEDLEELRRVLECPPDLPIVVGHNPMWKWGGNDSVWVNVLKTHDHVILYSGARETCPYLSFSGSPAFEIRYANLKLKQKRFVLDND